MKFFKMSAAGNDFILIENGAIQNPRSRAARLCDRREGIGADGLLVVYKKPELGLDYFNADGSSAFCGNGTRAAAWWMFDQGWAGAKRTFHIETIQGTLRAEIRGKERASIGMPPITKMKLKIPVRIAGRAYQVHWIHTGVPHAVVFVKNIERFPVDSVGLKLRRHSLFAPDGVNVDFIQIKSGKIHIRTYERGVEEETAACGTGAVAAAAIGARLGKAKSPIQIVARGGELAVSFKPDPVMEAEDVYLEGPARIIYQGEIA